MEHLSLRVLPDPDDVTRALIFLNGGKLAHLPVNSTRSPEDVRLLMRATASLPFFCDMQQELKAAWPRVHHDLCAGLQPVIVAHDCLLFPGIKSLSQPLLLISGGVVLLEQPSLVR